jgi:hypothetical protein
MRRHVYASFFGTKGALLEREILAQSINTGFDVANIQFDLQVQGSNPLTQFEDFLYVFYPRLCIKKYMSLVHC